MGCGWWALLPITYYLLLVFTTYTYYYFYLCYFSTTTATTVTSTTTSSNTSSNTVHGYRSSFLPALEQGETVANALPNLRDLHKFQIMRLLNYYLELITFDGHSQFTQISRLQY